MTHSDLEAILARNAWLRRIARGLIRDPGLADDLAQDVWIKSLEHGEDERSWLTVVLRNAGTRFFRSAGRERARREMIAHELAAPEGPAAQQRHPTAVKRTSSHVSASRAERPRQGHAGVSRAKRVRQITCRRSTSRMTE